MTHLHSIPGTANMHCQQVESNYAKPGALFNRRSQTGGDVVEFPFLCSRKKSKEARTSKLFPPQCVRAHSLPPWWHSMTWRGKDGNLARSCRVTPLLPQTMAKVPTIFTGAPVSHSQGFQCLSFLWFCRWGTSEQRNGMNWPKQLRNWCQTPKLNPDEPTRQ